MHLSEKWVKPSQSNIITFKNCYKYQMRLFSVKILKFYACINQTMSLLEIANSGSKSLEKSRTKLLKNGPLISKKQKKRTFLYFFQELEMEIKVFLTVKFHLKYYFLRSSIVICYSSIKMEKQKKALADSLLLEIRMHDKISVVEGLN